MLNFLRRTPPNLLGIDITSSTIRALELNQTEQSYQITHFGRIALKTATISENIVTNPMALSQAIQQLLRKMQTTTRLAAIAIPDSLTITKIIQLDPTVPVSELEEQIAIEAEKYIPYPLSEINLDFTLLKPIDPTQPTIDILLAAVRTENITPIVQALHTANLTVKIVDIQAYAIERASQLLKQQLPSQGRNQTVAIVDLTNTRLHLTVLVDLKMIYSREEIFADLENSDNKQTTIGNFYLQRALQFFFAANQNSELHAIVLSGSLAQMPDLAALITQQFNIPCTIANPLADMSIAPTVNKADLMAEASSLLVCCGLALRSLNYA